MRVCDEKRKAECLGKWNELVAELLSGENDGVRPVQQKVVAVGVQGTQMQELPVLRLLFPNLSSFQLYL